FVRSDFVETTTIDPLDYPNNYVVYSRNYLEKIFENSIPEAEEVVTELSAFEVAGNYEPISFTVYAFEDLENVAVEVSNLVSGGNVIGSEDIVVDRVVNMDQRWAWAYDEYYGKNPAYLSPLGLVDVDSGTSQQVWLTVFVPEQTPAGIYEGTVTISGDNIVSSEIPLGIEVFDINLEEPDATSTIYGDPFGIYRHWSVPKEVAADDMGRHGINPIIYFRPTITVDELTHEVVDVDYGHLETSLSYLSDLGILPENAMVDMREYRKGMWEDICGSTSNYLIDDCPQYDQEYTKLLQEYDLFFESKGLAEPVLTYVDEPGRLEDRRRESTHHNKMAKQEEYETYVTYYPFCEEPLAGHQFTFVDYSIDVVHNIPDWILGDNNLIAYWDFEGDFQDKSGNENHGTPSGTFIQDGVAVFDGIDDSVRVSDDPSLEGMGELTIAIWYNQTEVEKQALLAKSHVWAAYSLLARSSNQLAFFMRNMSGDYETEKTLYLPHYQNGWHHVTVVYNGTDCAYYSNGGLVGTKDCPSGEINTSYGDLRISWYNDGDNYRYFNGTMDEIMFFNRTLSEQEVQDIVLSTGLESYDNEQSISLSVNLDAGVEVPDMMSFSIDDLWQVGEWSESVKKIIVNGQEAWSKKALDKDYQIFEVDISQFVNGGESNIIEFSVTNNYSVDDDFVLYFIDDFWRDSDWQIIQNSDNWVYDYEPDPFGDLGPMGPYLDYRVHAMQYLTEENQLRTIEEGDYFTYYTTYPANQPAFVNNRFLNGIYASARDVPYVLVYGYGSFESDPYDDMSTSRVYKLSVSSGLRGQNDYNMILPSWEPVVYDMLIYESLREGIEDSKIIATLEKAIADNPGTLADEAQSYLDEIFSKPSGDYQDNYWWLDDPNEVPIEKYADRSEEILFDMSGDVDNYGFFDDTRRQMIDYIVALQTGTEPPPGDPGGPGGPSGAPTQCSDGIDNDGDGFIDYPEDPECGSYNDNDESTFDFLFGNITCEELWYCGDWTACVNGTRTRECYDIHYCGTNDEIPEMESECDDYDVDGGDEIEGARYDVIFVGIISFVALGILVGGLVVWILRVVDKRK
ncbi:MAG: glycoside hydrolase domain-containing protein, partial [Nanoarchaeota archaeon]